MTEKEFEYILHSLTRSNEVEKVAPGKSEEFRRKAEELLYQKHPRSEDKETFNRKEKHSLSIGLKTLTVLSQYSKQQWLAIINEYNLDINLNPRDSARDVLNKLLRYLAKNPDAAQSGKKKPLKYEKDDESELTKALNILLEDHK